MADIELIIKLSEEDYTDICKCSYPNDILVGELVYQVRNNAPLSPHGRLIDADELLKRIDKVAKKPSLSIDTINGLCGAIAIIYDMLIETGQEKGEE